MSRPPGSHKYAWLPLCREMALLIETGQAEDYHAAARAVERKAEGSNYGDARRRRLRKYYLLHKRALHAWASARIQPPRGDLKSAARSMQRGIDHMLWLERSVHERQARERAAEVIESEQARIKRAAE
jgi:hypothetical protein